MTDRPPIAPRAPRAARARVGFAAVMGLVACSGACNDGGAPGGSRVENDSAAAQGLVALTARKCGDCHEPLEGGEGTLSGRATAVPGTQAYPGNLTPDPDTGMDAWDAGSIAAALLSGIDDLGQPLCSAMPRFAEAGMTGEEALAIAAYLQGLTPVWHPVPASTCLIGPPRPADAGL